MRLHRRGAMRLSVLAGKDNVMAKGQQRSGKEQRKPKKPAPPKPNASKPSLKGTPGIAPVV